MRTIPIVTIAAIAIASTATAYYFLRDNNAAQRAAEAKPSIGSPSPLNVQNTPIRDGRRDQPTHLEQTQLLLLQEQVATLAARLHNMETAVSEQSQRQAVAGPVKPVSNTRAKKAKANKVSEANFSQGMNDALDTDDFDHDATTSVRAQTKVNKVSEADFAHWMDEALDAGDFDHDTTTLLREQAETSFANVPDINLDDMQCSARFCRATLTPATGQQLHIAQLLGAFPFMDAGTILQEPDGSVRVYFVQPGQSFSELRSEAQKAHEEP
jgi:hypothetical protein